jgi:hypothetical protein
MSQLRVGQVLECHANGSRWRVMHQLPGRVRVQLLHTGLDAELAQRSPTRACSGVG